MSRLSRRDFALVAAAAAAATALPETAFAQTPPPPTSSTAPSDAPATESEVELRYRQTIARYGSRFTEEQKKELRRLITGSQAGLDAIRSFSLSNGDQPAMSPYVPSEPLGGRR